MRPEWGNYFGAFPDILRVLCILFDDWQDARRYNSVGSTEIMIDLLEATLVQNTGRCRISNYLGGSR